MYLVLNNHRGAAAHMWHIALADAEIARQICVKHFKVFPDRSMFYPPQPQIYKEVLSQGITFAK